MTHDTPLYVITHPGATTVVFNIFPRDLGIIRPGMRIEVEAQDGRTVVATALGHYLSAGNAEAGTALIRAAIPNRGGSIRPGITIRGRVIVNPNKVSLAARSAVNQPFRALQVEIECKTRKSNNEYTQ